MGYAFSLGPCNTVSFAEAECCDFGLPGPAYRQAASSRHKEVMVLTSCREGGGLADLQKHLVMLGAPWVEISSRGSC